VVGGEDSGFLQVGRRGALGTRPAQDHMGAGGVAGGMIPKAEACLAAVRNGVGSAHLLNGTQPHVLLLELFTDAGVGTMIRPDPQDAGP